MVIEVESICCSLVCGICSVVVVGLFFDNCRYGGFRRLAVGEMRDEEGQYDTIRLDVI